MINKIFIRMTLLCSYTEFKDCGANLTNKKFIKDLDQVIHRAQDSGKNGKIIYDFCYDLVTFFLLLFDIHSEEEKKIADVCS